MSDALRSLLGLVLILGVAVAASGCGESDPAAEAEPAVVPDIPVAVATLQTGEIDAVLRAWAEIRASREAEIQAEVGGRVAAVHVALGEAVERGALLLEIDPGVHQANLGEAEANHESAAIALQKAEKDFSRAEGMYAAKSVSDTEFEEARSRVVAARAVMASMKARLAQARNTLDDARVRAPFAGTIAVRPPDAGGTVIPGQVLTRIVDLDRLRLVAGVSEHDLAGLVPGITARVSVEGVPGRVFTGRVTAIGPQADEASRQFPVELAVKNPGGRPLRAGMIANVEIVTRHFDAVPLLPVDALVERDGATGFYVLEDGAARWRVAETGPRRDGRVALLSGGEGGEQVIVLGQTRLADGARVSVEPAP